MLGQLLHSFNPSRRGTPRQSSNLIESVTEDSHTRNLLFPDAHALVQNDSQQAFPQIFSTNSPAGSASYDSTQAGIDLDQHRDFRIIIAQDEAGATPRAVLFDSKPVSGSAESPSAASERKSSRLFGAGGGAGGPMSPGPVPGSSSSFTPGHGRRSSLAAQGSVPQSPTVSAFQRARTRGASISNMQTFEESAQNVRSRESEEIVRTCLDCMFGSAPMAYRGPSNKLHIIPMEPRASERNVTSPPLHEGFSSFGRSEGRKQSRLATSYTASNIPPEPSHNSGGLQEASQKEVRRRTILITRLFSVSPPDEVEMPDSSDSNSTTPTPGSTSGKGSSYPFPSVNGSGSSQYSGKRSSRQCRTPMYAIGIILHLPVSPPTRAGSAPQKAGSKSQGGQDSLGSSFDSDRRAGWAFVDATFGVDSLLSISGNSDVDDRVDVIGQHWDVIVRTLTSLQFVVQDKVMSLFKAAEQMPPQTQTPSRTHGSQRSHRDPMMLPRRMLKLQSSALLFDPDVKQAVDCAADRVVRGMKVPRVITGQGRWGVWREEARWLGRWAGGREQNFFLYNLLTAFLGTHTEWLNILGPKSYRTKHREQQRSIAGEDITIASRTVIVSPDKMAARRLIFLLANFLPASNHGFLDGASPVRPSTSTSLRGYSQSPPNAAVSRQQSLRRTINRKGHKSYPNMSSLNVARGSNSDLPEDKVEEKEKEEKRPPSRSVPHSRRPSQVHSIKSINATGLAIPSMVEDPAARKGSTTTTSTVTPETAVPVAHFAVHRHNSGSTSSNEARPPSSGSLASVNLRHTLHRTGSGATSPSNDSSASKWGSFMSFWSAGGRRESSTDHSDILQSTDDGVGIGGPGYRRTYNHSASKLEQMVQELQVDDFDQEDSEDYEAAANTERNSMSPGGPHSAARAIPARSKQLDSPLKLSVNENDGVIDVDIALPGFGSPIQSPLLPALGNSVSSLDGSTFGPSFCSSAISFESQPPVNVAGWLARYHQDFALQGVQPYADLEKDVRRSMSAEPTPIAAVTTPTLESGPMEKWVHICTALIADARTFTIKRLHLKRKVRLIPVPSQPAITPGAGLSAQTPGPHSLPKSQYGNPYTNGSSLMPAVPMTELHLEERFVEETVMDLDETLADALEKGIASSGVSTPALSNSTSSILPTVSTPTQRTHGPSHLHDKNMTPQTRYRLQEQDEDVSPKKKLPASSSVATSTTASATASASSSRSSSRRGRGSGPRNGQHHESSDAASTITSLEAGPRGCQECKSLVLGALEQVVRSVAAERTGSFMPARAGERDSTSSAPGTVKQGMPSKQQRGRRANNAVVESLHKESTLREGVRRWLAQVEDGN